MATPPTQAKSRTKLVQAPKKICSMCKEKKTLDEFLNNPQWSKELGKDKWCKTCVSRLPNKDSVKEYCWENRREWNEDIWKDACKAAKDKLANNTVFKNSSEDRRKLLLDKTAIQCLPLALSRHYKFIELPEGTEQMSYAEALATGKVSLEDDDPTLKEYSEFFNGYFNKQELEYLTNYYNKLEEDFSFDNENLRDYAKKCARASLQADKAQDNYAAGRCSFADVKDALMQFDMLSKSANFAACKRKTGESSGLTCWAETTLYLETHGYCKETKVEWPEDDVDRVIKSFNHTVASLGL